MDNLRLGVTAFLTDRAMGPAELARAVEERGFHSLFLPEHTHLPVRADTPPGLVDGVDREDYRRSLDPLVALAAAATVTDRLILGTGVLLVAQHDPIVLAKALATLDHLSGGRVRLGIGFGWNRPEAEDHGVAFEQRHEIAAEHVAALRALWHDHPAEFHGRHVDLAPCWTDPKPTNGTIQVLIGGGAGPRVLSAVARYGDGWLPIGGGGLSTALPELRRRVEEAGRDPATVAVVPFGTIPTRGKLEHFAALGITEVILRARAAPAGEMLRQLDDLAGFLG